MHILIASGLDSVTADQWNRLAGDDNPFLIYGFLRALETSGCVGGNTGWQPRHLLLFDNNGANDALVGAVPLYLKHHSYGEYVFDWAWAEAYRRAGLEYYPKLVAAVPFTPATGPRLLCAPDADRDTVARQLVDGALAYARESGASSLHWLFTPETDTALLERHSHLRRSGYQFHWSNNRYRNFDDYLSALTAAKRKKIRRERRYVMEAGIEMVMLQGHAIDDAVWDQFYGFYLSTIRVRGAIPYLNLDFFKTVGRALGERVLLVLGRRNSTYVAGSLFFRGRDTLYGRYWGASEHHHTLHFETCYYAAIEFCIETGMSRFEAGAQGEHKLSRGFLPTTTWSAHWLSHPEFSRAVADFLARERAGIEYHMDELHEHSPFRCPD
jgi:predicted N-acyltransferase